MSKPIQTSGPAREIESFTGVKGGLALRIDEVIIPVKVLSAQPRKFAIGHGVAAAAVGFRSEIVLVNTLPFGPSIEDTSVLVHMIWATLVTATNRIELVRTDGGVAAFTNLTTKSFLDLPKGTGPSAAIQFKNSAVQTVGSVIAQKRALANTTVEFDFRKSPMELNSTIASANGILVRPGSDNELMDVTYLWSEPPDLL